MTSEMSDRQRFGAPAEEARRWRRVVMKLDERVPQWRNNRMGERGFLGDAALAVINQLTSTQQSCLGGGRREVSEPFRTDASMRQWKTSYTKRVVDGLEKAYAEAYGAIARISPPIQAAINLLKDYHATMHFPYADRDRARATLKLSQQNNTKLHAQIARLQADLANYRSHNLELASEATVDKLSRQVAELPKRSGDTLVLHDDWILHVIVKDRARVTVTHQ